MTTEKKYPVKECDYCDHVGMAYTTMTGETICKSCLSDLPTYAAECRKLIVEQRKRIAELEKEVERLNAHSLIFDAASELNDDLKKKLEAAERELETERMISMKRFVETGRADTFAIQQQIKVLEDLLGRVCPVSGEVIPDNLSRDAIHDEINQLRQQLNGG